MAVDGIQACITPTPSSTMAMQTLGPRKAPEASIIDVQYYGDRQAHEYESTTTDGPDRHQGKPDSCQRVQPTHLGAACVDPGASRYERASTRFPAAAANGPFTSAIPARLPCTTTSAGICTSAGIRTSARIRTTAWIRTSAAAAPTTSTHRPERHAGSHDRPRARPSSYRRDAQ